MVLEGGGVQGPLQLWQPLHWWGMQRVHALTHARTHTGNDPPYLQTIQTDEAGYSKSINDILLLRAGLPSLPPGGTRGSGGGCGARRLFTGQGGGVPPRAASLPVGAGGVGVGAAGVPAPCLPQPPHPLPLLGATSPTLLQFAVHVAGGKLAGSKKTRKYKRNSTDSRCSLRTPRCTVE